MITHSVVGHQCNDYFSYKSTLLTFIYGRQLLIYTYTGCLKKQNRYKCWINSYQWYLSLNNTVTHVKLAAFNTGVFHLDVNCFVVSQHSYGHDTQLHGFNKEKYPWYSSINVYTNYSALTWITSAFMCVPFFTPRIHIIWIISNKGKNNVTLAEQSRFHLVNAAT